EDGIRDFHVTGVQTCALPISITNVPVTVFAKGAYFALPAIGKLDCQTVGLDWNMPIAQTREIIGPDKTLQGNLDPCALYGSFDEIGRASCRERGQYVWAVVV